MNATKLTLADHVSGTATNAEGYALFLVLDEAIRRGESLRISLVNCGPLSSSFLNSSFGALFEEHGIEVVRQKIVFTHYLRHHARTLTRYFDDYSMFLS